MLGRDLEGEQLLRRLGETVRRRREERALSQRALAAVAQLSPRFLADLEAGRANISIGRLAKLARALQVALPELVTFAEEPTGRRPVALIGLRGAGKSTIGPRLAGRLAVSFIELDTQIEEVADLPLGQIFELHGEAYYRRLERETLKRLLDDVSDAVIAVGGGVVSDRESYHLLRQCTFTVWLRARPEDHWNRVVQQGDRRPMAAHPHAMAELRALLSAREALYAEAELTVDTSRLALTDAVEQIAKALGRDEVKAVPPASQQRRRQPTS